MKAADFDALFVPGGFGAAKNLSSFATQGGDMEVIESVRAVMNDFYSSRKYIGMCCIAPIIAARLFSPNCGGSGVKLTLGSKGDSYPYAGSIDVATGFGNSHVMCDLTEICHDDSNRLVTAPAYMNNDATAHEIFQNVSMMVDAVVEAARK